jgi:hypothetical protein
MQEYVTWYLVSQVVCLVLLFAKPSFFISYSPDLSPEERLQNARKEFATLATGSFLPFYREIGMIGTVFYWLSTKRLTSV